jgi:hypothetical protein
MNISAKYMKVWKKETNDYGVTLNLGESKKKYNADGYDNWTWFKCKVKGNASHVEVNEGDTIEIKSGLIQQFKSNEGKYFNDVVIFEMEVMTKGQQQSVGSYETHQQKPNVNDKPSYENYPTGNSAVQNFEDSIPF